MVLRHAELFDRISTERKDINCIGLEIDSLDYRYREADRAFAVLYIYILIWTEDSGLWRDCSGHWVACQYLTGRDVLGVAV